MPRAATNSDVFNAVAEPYRRAILDRLAEAGEQPVGSLVETTGLGQPSVSKHLRILKQVGLVSARREGRQRVYRLNADAMRPITNWVRTLDAHLDRQLDQIKQRAERTQQQQGGRDDSDGTQR